MRVCARFSPYRGRRRGGFSALAGWPCATVARRWGILAVTKHWQQIADASEARVAQLALGDTHLTPPDMAELGESPAVGEVFVA